MSHLSQEEFDALVVEGGPLSDASRRHLAACAACTRRLAREAKLELAVYDAAATPGLANGVRRSDVRPWQFVLPAAATLALVVALVLLQRPARAPAPPDAPEAIVHGPAEPPCLQDPRTLSPGYDPSIGEIQALDAAAPGLRPAIDSGPVVVD